jgi:uncharacterized protein (DUF608 family)
MVTDRDDATPYPPDELFVGNEVRTFGADADALAFPLGGIGTGNVALGARGELRDWELFNRPSKGVDLPYSFFAIRTETHAQPTESVARVLEAELNPPHCPPRTSPHGYTPRTTGGLPRLDDATVRGTYPTAHVTFEDADLPVTVELEAYTPFVPLDPESSGIPVAMLEYTVSNPTSDALDVSLMGSFPNVAGYLADEQTVLDGFPHAGGNRNTVREADSMTAIEYTTEAYDADHIRYGEFALGLLENSADVFHKAAWPRSEWWDDYDSVWREFVDDGRLDPNSYEEPSADGEFDVGSLGVSRTLEPGEETTATFLLTWYVPNRAHDWKQPDGENEATPGQCCSGTTDATATDDAVVQNHYATRFDGAWNVATTVAERYDTLRRNTYEFRDAFFDTTVPGYVLDAVSSGLSVARSPTCIWLADGSFLGFEGCNERQGCCEGTCTHVWNYAQTLARMFPSLEREMRRIDFEESTTEDGFMWFRTPLPFDGDVEFDLDGQYDLPAADGQMGTIMRLYREWRFSGDDAFLERLWPHAKRALEFAFEYEEWDPDEDGVMTGEQHTTLDVEYFGPNSVAGGWYLGALSAGARMARAVGDAEAATRYETILERGSNALDEHCWNGDHYVQALDDVDAFPHQYGDGCHINQVIGAWFATMLDLEDILPPEHVRSALDALFRKNFVADHSALHNTQRAYAVNDDAGLLVCTWDDEPPSTPVPYHSETQCGYEYQAAAHMIYAGLVEEGLTVTKAIRDRHDGVKRNPWDEFECGSHYARSMASWSIYEALAGYSVDMRSDAAGVNDRGFNFDPVINADEFTGFWITNTAWGRYEQSVGSDGGENSSVEVLFERE